MYRSLENLCQQLALEQLDTYLFRGTAGETKRRVYGGQVLAQALSAALQTVDSGLRAHSMHGYFLRPGDSSIPIIFEVDPIRDGGSFCTRRVVAKQRGRAIFNSSISLQKPENGLDHQMTMPQVAGPDGLQSDAQYWAAMRAAHPGKFDATFLPPLEMRRLVRRDPFDPQPIEPQFGVWMRTTEAVSAEQNLQQILLAYMSDLTLLGTALHPHPYTTWSKNLQFASLDHALWFHRDVKVDEWLLYYQDSPTAQAGRGLSRGSFYNQAGLLVASTVQESLIRVRHDSTDGKNK